MTWWTVSTEDKKSVFEHELWQKDDMVIRRITGFRWGTVLIETDGDNPPVLDQTDGPGADGVDMYNTDYNWELDNLSDGWYEDFIWPDEMPEEERDRLLALWEEDGYGGWEEDGWDAYETECWFHGPLEIARHEDVWTEERIDEINREAQELTEKMHEPKFADDGWEKAEITPELQDLFQEGLGNKQVSKTTWPFPTGNPGDSND